MGRRITRPQAQKDRTIRRNDGFRIDEPQIRGARFDRNDFRGMAQRGNWEN